jgi:hypothetical protein
MVQRPIGVLVSFDLSSQQTVQQGTPADESRAEEREEVERRSGAAGG